MCIFNSEKKSVQRHIILFKEPPLFNLLANLIKKNLLICRVHDTTISVSHRHFIKQYRITKNENTFVHLIPYTIYVRKLLSKTSSIVKGKLRKK